MSLPSSESKSNRSKNPGETASIWPLFSAGSLIGLLFYPESAVDLLLRNVGLSKNHMILQPTSLLFSVTPVSLNFPKLSVVMETQLFKFLNDLFLEEFIHAVNIYHRHHHQQQQQPSP
jgi:hypothetical protein